MKLCVKKMRVWTFCECTQTETLIVPGKLNEKKISFKEGVRSSLIPPSRKTTETISKNNVPDVFKYYFMLIIDNTFKTANTTHCLLQ